MRQPQTACPTTWENKDAADRFRTGNKDHYYDRKHDSAPAAGWRDSDRYWEHH
jgi:hypothetical protein